MIEFEFEGDAQEVMFAMMFFHMAVRHVEAIHFDEEPSAQMLPGMVPGMMPMFPGQQPPKMLNGQKRSSVHEDQNASRTQH